jgi:hypothetical protein
MLSSKRSPITKQITLASILGILVFGPSFYFDALNVENAAVRFPVCLNSFLYILRTLEGEVEKRFLQHISSEFDGGISQHLSFLNFSAYFGFTPEGAKRSALMYCIYFVLPVDIVYDAKCQKPVKATRNDVLHKLWFLVSTFVFNVLLLAILCHTDYLPFGPTNAGRYDRSTLLRDYFDPRHLGNCFFLGCEYISHLVSVLNTASLSNSNVICRLVSMVSTAACVECRCCGVCCGSTGWLEMQTHDS